MNNPIENIKEKERIMLGEEKSQENSKLS